MQVKLKYVHQTLEILMRKDIHAYDISHMNYEYCTARMHDSIGEAELLEWIGQKGIDK